MCALVAAVIEVYAETTPIVVTVAVAIDALVTLIPMADNIGTAAPAVTAAILVTATAAATTAVTFNAVLNIFLHDL